ncbi:type II secretion system F family protein [Micromonospora sp. WMMD980]|uniref:type II secretion system F family protein n=1 Tax=Micromonospora sp. WMMD980 TaxID=3016088 RepID=UPI002416E4C3|nr:type II secretion system F family protein [Micromonospora sp. WMMD980]MDG4803623.1 type II secretion system F family protein [Micromonospora sp. WMMD980]
MSLLPILLGLGCAAGLTLIVDGLRRRPLVNLTRRRRRGWAGIERARFLAVLGGGAAAAMVTRWPVAAPLAGVAVWALPRVLGPDREHNRAVARIEAIATWAELLRDTLSSAAGLEQAITATAPVTPQPIRPQVQALAAAVRAGARLPDALRVLADDLADATADLVVAALTQAAGYHGGQLSQCLTSLAVTARELAGIRMRVATKRAATRTAARVITGTAAAMVAGLIVLNRGFLAPYHGVTGQLVLLVVGAVFTAGFWWLARVSRLPEPPRVLAKAGIAAGQGRSS